jgi:DMSO/TMAO reductase YedYZ molybdopterin-dependent catalytic subunit
MLRVDGSVRRPGNLGFEELAALPGQIEDVAALVPGRHGGAVALRALLEAVGVAEHASRVTLESTDGKFSQQAPLASLEFAVLVYRLADGPLPESLGGPVRFLIPGVEDCGVPGVDRCTNVKALGHVRIE